jgi:hypothetical protein
MKIKSSYKMFSILMMLLLSSCLPVSKETTCADSEAYDAEQRRCVPTIADGPNTIFITNSIPASSAYVTNLNSSAISHSVSISNQYNNPFTFRWNLYSGVTTTTVSLGSNYTLLPSSLVNPGSYILEAGIYSADGTILYDSKTWTITVEALATPTLTNNIPSINVISYASNITSAIHSLDITNPDSISGDYRTLIGGIPFNSGTFNSGTTSLSSTIDPSSLGMGLHSVEVQLLRTGTTIEYDSFVWTVHIIEPDLPKISLATSTPSLYNAISAIDGVSFQNTTSGTPADSGYRDINNDAINKFCVVVDDADKDSDGSSDVQVTFEINGAQQGGIGVFTQGGPITTANPNDNTYCHENFNPQSLINSDISESRTLLIKSFSTASGSIIETVQYDLKVRPKNLRPLISIDNTTNPSAVPCSTINSSVLYSDCEMTQSSDVDNNSVYTDAEDTDSSKQFAITFLTDSDPDITSDADFNVFYEIKSTDPTFQAMDGTSNLSKTDCTASATKTNCSINIDAFNSNGSIAPGTYTIQAYIADMGSVWDPGNPKESNRVSWQVEVKELQTTGSISIATQSILNATPIAVNESWLENTGASCASTNAVVNSVNSISENDFLTVHTYVKDRERDNFNISMTITNGLGGGVTPIVGTTNIIRSNDDEFVEVINCFKVPEYVTSGAANSLATLNVYVTDITDDVSLPAQFGTNAFTLSVDNYNPNPTFDDNSDVDMSLLSSFAGLPFNLSAPTFNDLNTTDGNQISYLWQVSDDNTTWIDIPNANSTDQSNASLIWTAAPTLSGPVSFRLCLGDDGFGNPADCSLATATKRYLNLNIIASTVLVESIAQGSQLDNDKRNITSWLDQTNAHLYTVYSVGTDIYINKKSTNLTGVLVDEHTISFPTESTTDLTRVPVTPDNLSIDGIDGSSIIVSYNLLDSVDADKRLRLRRLDITNGLITYKYGGFYNGDLDTNDAVENISVAGMTFNTTSDGDLAITINSVNNGDSFDISTASGLVSLIVGTNVGDLCNPTACPDTATLAANIASFINDHTNPEISKEHIAIHTTGQSTLTIRGSQVEDYYNGANSMAYIGNISIRPIDNLWAVPFVDINNSSKLNIIRGSNADQSLNGIFPSQSTSIETGEQLKDIKGKFLTLGDYIISTINDDNNMDIYKLNTAFTLQADKILGAYNLGVYDVKEYDLDIGSDGIDEFIYIAAKLEDSSGATKLSAIMSEIDLINYVATDTFTIANTLTANLDKVKLSASQTNKGEASLAIMTSATNSSPNNLHIAKITHPMTVPTYVNDISFEVSSDTAYSSPRVNTDSLLLGSSLSLTKSFTATKGHLSESSDPVTPDVTREVYYINYMEDDGAGQSLLNLNTINTHKESVMSNTAAGLLSYPSFLKN